VDPPLTTDRHRRRSAVVRLALGAVAGALVVAGCAGGGADRSADEASRAPDPVASATTPRAPDSTSATGDGVVVGEEVEQAVLEAAAADGLVRWPTGLVTVGWTGRVTPRDEEILRDAIGRLSALTGLDLRATGAGSIGPDTDIEVVFAPPGEWPVAPDGDPAHVLGVTEARWTGEGELVGAVVAVDSTIEQSLRNQTIVHELVHAVGVGHVECPTSIIHGGSDGAPTWLIGPLDEALLQTWYDPRLRTGEPASALSSAIEGVPGGPTCEPVSFELVRFPAEEGGGAVVLWCETGPGARPCVAVDGLGDPPAAPLTDPLRWVLDRTIYDHDPTRYTAVQVEGRRALCDLEGGDRRPCQFTDGPGPLTGVDFWTDGTFLYDTP
jgi:hypothetical protein